MSKHYACEVCKKKFRRAQLYPLAAMRDSLICFIKKHYSPMDINGFICKQDLDEQSLAYTENMLTAELVELDELEQKVLDSFASKETLEDNLSEYEDNLTFGNRLADIVSDFAGSWTFIIIFLIICLAWMMLNSYVLFFHFDPYPYILLNLALSTLAALQAPIILMSQNRKSDRDRLQAEYDYKVNVKAELQIRNLNSKIDHLIKKLWLHMMETQESQIKLQKKILDKIDSDK